MDGFHYDNSILKARNQFSRKGAPETFDVAGLTLLLSALGNQQESLAAPVFDREMDLARGSAKLIQPNDHIILVEGNYLLCDTTPWSHLHRFFDYSVFLNTSIHTIEERLIQRWLDHDHTQEQAIERTRQNDLPNAQYVIDHSIAADNIITN